MKRRTYKKLLVVASLSEILNEQEVSRILSQVCFSLGLDSSLLS